MKLIDRLKDKIGEWMAPTIHLQGPPTRILKVTSIPEKPALKQYGFSVKGARFVVYARTETLAWAKARRIANNNKDLRRIA